MSEAAGHDVGLGEAVTSYVRDVLTPLPSEQEVVSQAWDDDEWTIDDWAAGGWVTEEIPVTGATRPPPVEISSEPDSKQGDPSQPGE